MVTRYPFTFLALGLLAGCAGVSVEAQLAASCSGYGSTMYALSTVRSEMTPAQDAAVEASTEIVVPLCASAAAGTLGAPESALFVVRDMLRETTLMQQEVGR